jgi:hypothetical protein
VCQDVCSVEPRESAEPNNQSRSSTVSQEQYGLKVSLIIFNRRALAVSLRIGGGPIAVAYDCYNCQQSASSESIV